MPPHQSIRRRNQAVESRLVQTSRTQDIELHPFVKPSQGDDSKQKHFQAKDSSRAAAVLLPPATFPSPLSGAIAAQHLIGIAVLAAVSVAISDFSPRSPPRHLQVVCPRLLADHIACLCL